MYAVSRAQRRRRRRKRKVVVRRPNRRNRSPERQSLSPKLQRLKELAAPVPRKSSRPYKSDAEEFDRNNRAATERLKDRRRNQQRAAQNKVDQFLEWQQKRDQRPKLNVRMPKPVLNKKKLARMRKKNIHRAKLASQSERQVGEQKEVSK